MKKTLQLCFICLVMFGAQQSQLFAQGGVGINATGAPPDNSAILDISSTNKGLLIPRMSTAQRTSISGPGTSLMVFDTTNNCLEMYGYGVWHTITCICSAAPSAPGIITGNASPCSGASNVVYSVAPVAGANFYVWTVPSGASILTGQGTNSILVNIGSTPGNVSVSAGNDCGTSGANSYPITINTIPSTPGSIGGSSTFPHNQTGASYSVAAISGATTYTWTIPGDATIASGQGTDSLTINFGTSNGNICVTAGNICGTSTSSCTFVTDCYSQGTQLFAFTSNQQVFTVPVCVTSITIAAYGAQGYPYNSPTAGLGGYAVGNLAVTPGQILYVYVGGEGAQPTGGYNGGATGGWSGGGGASDVRTGTDLSTRIIVAGGGGGTTAWGSNGGVGGGDTGGVASNSNYYSCGSGVYGIGGSGGTQSGGGASGTYAGNQGGNNGQPGSLGVGGGTDSWNNGGGGGGYYGGGSGATPGCSGWGSGGGGGSSYLGGVTNGTTTPGSNSGNGSITISW